MPLNIVQQKFCNEVYRPYVEKTIAALNGLMVYTTAYSDLQASSDAIAANATVLDDDGDAPRDDAPNITGQDLADLNAHMLAINAILTDPERQALRGKAVRTLPNILGD